MNKIEMQDERVQEERRKIQSRGYALVVWALIAALLVQMLRKAPAAQYRGELFILIGCGVYQIIANLYHGMNIWQNEDTSLKRQLNSILIAGVLAGLLVTVLDETRDIASLGVFLLIFMVLNFAMRCLLSFWTRKRQEKMERELDDDE